MGQWDNPPVMVAKKKTLAVKKKVTKSPKATFHETWSLNTTNENWHVKAPLLTSHDPKSTHVTVTIAVDIVHLLLLAQKLLQSDVPRCLKVAFCDRAKKRHLQEGKSILGGFTRPVNDIEKRDFEFSQSQS